MKKILLLFTLLIWSFGYGQTTVHNGAVKVKTVGVYSVTDSIVTIDVDGLLKYRPYSTFAQGGGGDVTKVGTPLVDQVGVWTGDGTIKGDPNFKWETANGLILDDRGIRFEGNNNEEGGMRLYYAWASSSSIIDLLGSNFSIRDGINTMLSVGYSSTPGSSSISLTGIEIADIDFDKSAITKEYLEYYTTGSSGVNTGDQDLSGYASLSGNNTFAGTNDFTLAVTGRVNQTSVPPTQYEFITYDYWNNQPIVSNWGDIGGSIVNQTDLQAELDDKLDKLVVPISKTLSYTTNRTENSMHIDFTGAATTITLDDANVDVNNQFTFFNNTGAPMTWAYGAGPDAAIQGTLPDVPDGYYAWATLKAANSWSVMVSATGGAGDAVLANNQTFTGINTFQNNVGTIFEHGSGYVGGTGGKIGIANGAGFSHSLTGNADDLTLTIGSEGTPYTFGELWASIETSVMTRHDSDTRYRPDENYARNQNDTYSTYGTGWTDGDNVKTGTAATGTLTTNGRFTGASTHEIYLTITVSSYTSGTLEVKAGNSAYSANTITSAGTFRYKFINTSSANLYTINPTVAFTGTISDIRYDSGFVLDEMGSGGLTLGIDSNGDVQEFRTIFGVNSATEATASLLFDSNDNANDVGMFFTSNSSTGTGDLNFVNLSYFDGSGSIATDFVLDAWQNTSASMTVGTSDMGTMIYCGSPSAQTVTLPDTMTLIRGATFTVVQEGAGAVTIDPTGTTQINGATTSLVVDGLWGTIQFIHLGDGSDDWHAIGNITP